MAIASCCRSVSPHHITVTKQYEHGWFTFYNPHAKKSLNAMYSINRKRILWFTNPFQPICNSIQVKGTHMVLVWSKSWLCLLSVWLLQCLNVMSCPEEVVCYVCRRCKRDRMKMCPWLRAAAAAAAAPVELVFTAAAAAPVALVFTAAAAASEITWLLTAPTLTSRGHSSTRNLPFPVCFVLLACKSWQICIFS